VGGRRVIPLLVLLSIPFVAVPAEAALWMEFEPPRGDPGTKVVGRTVGNGAMRAGDGPYPAYLVPVATNDRTPIGEVVVDDEDNGTLRFTVPDVPGGKYEIRIHCEPCAPYSAGRTELPLGEFRVLGPAILPPVEPGQSDLVSIAVLVACCVLLGGLGFHRNAAPSRMTTAR
jgi:hypothetical protein